MAMVSSLRYLLACILLSMTVPAFGQAAMQPAMMRLHDASDAAAIGTAKMVGAILEYAHWPIARPHLQLCIAGTAQHAERLTDIQLSNGATLAISPAGEQKSLPLVKCDALYIGRVDEAAMRQLIAGVRGKPVLTIAEDDPECRSGSMFCLIFTPRTISFQLSVDAVSRSAVRVDPRVLRLSQGAY
ncbi:YfiR family protein [Sphingobium sp. EM0848]|uniref:YfiR family protein n=1 Tax=Sphingobium sp. EM0848 TaxID=2743473 RepID=UPI00159CB85A|nr:YfiR family protein [Sphingobium sp. EM0848]